MHFKDLRVTTKLSLLMGTAALGLLVFGVVAYNTIKTVQIGGETYDSIDLHNQLISDLIPPDLNILTARLAANMMTVAKDHAEMQTLADRIAQGDKKFEQAKDDYLKKISDPKLKDAIANKVYPPGRQWLDATEKEYVPAMLSGDLKKGGEILAQDPPSRSR